MSEGWLWKSIVVASFVVVLSDRFEVVSSVVVDAGATVEDVVKVVLTDKVVVASIIVVMSDRVVVDASVVDTVAIVEDV